MPPLRISTQPVALTWHWRWQRGLRCRIVLLVATPPAAGRWAGWAAWGPASRCCWSAGTPSRPAASAAHCSWNTGTNRRAASQRGAINNRSLTETQMQMWHFLFEMARPFVLGTQTVKWWHTINSPQERGRRGLGSDRSLDRLQRTHSGCGSDRVSPGLQRCWASPQRTAPSPWCHRQTAAKPNIHTWSSIQQHFLHVWLVFCVSYHLPY